MNYVAVGLRFIAAVIVAGLLGAAGRGELAVLLVAGELLGRGVLFGLPISAANEIRDSIRPMETYGYASRLAAILSLAAIPIAIGSVWVNGGSFPLAILALAISGASHHTVFLTGLAVHGPTFAYLVSVRSAAVVLILVGIGEVTVGLDTEVASSCYAFGYAIPALTSTTSRKGLELKWVTARMRRSLGLLPMSILQYATNRVDQLVVAAAGGVKVAGVYAVATTLAQPVLQWGHVQAAKAFSIVSGYADLRRLVASVSRPQLFLLGVSITVSIGLGYAAGIILGADFAAVGHPTLVLAVGGIAFAASAGLAQVALRNQAGAVSTGAEAVGLAVNAALVLALVPALGAIGAATASTVAYVVRAATYEVWLRRRHAETSDS